MEGRERFLDLFEYTREMNDLFIDLAEACSSEKAGRLMNHIINAQQIWLDRMQSREMSLGPWFLRENTEALKDDNRRLFLEYSNLLNDFAEITGYSNTKGRSFQNRTSDILYHVVNHATHHRAQIAIMARGEGLEVPPSDYIFYKRKSS